MSISPDKKHLPPLDPKALQDERMRDDFGTHVTSKERKEVTKKTSNLFEKHKKPSEK